MDPEQTGRHYDRIAAWWEDAHADSGYGVAPLRQAIRFAAGGGPALDVGCGSSGRLIRVMIEHGFAPEGLDVSREMVARARRRHPLLTFHHADVCTWEPPRRYDLVSAWDSTFHLPIERHEPVMVKLCGALTVGGVLLFTCGPARGEVAGEFQGERFEYASLGVPAYLALLAAAGCECVHLEHDQYPEPHVFVVARRSGAPAETTR